MMEYVTYREFSAVKYLTEKWIEAELKARDKAVEVADVENKAVQDHLNNVRMTTLPRVTFERETEEITRRITTLEGFRNKSIGVIMGITAFSGTIGGLIGYVITQLTG